MSNDVPIQNLDDVEISGLVLFGETQILVGLSNSQWLRVPLSSCGGLGNLSDDNRLDYRLADRRSQLSWPGHGIDLSIQDLTDRAIALEDGDRCPD